jgi:hypothetical protein
MEELRQLPQVLCPLGWQLDYLTLPLDLPILLAIFFRFFCHSGLVKSISHSTDQAREEKNLFCTAYGHRTSS